MIKIYGIPKSKVSPLSNPKSAIQNPWPRPVLQGLYKREALIIRATLVRYKQIRRARAGWNRDMFTGFSKIIEERIRKAQKKGVFENLEGSGKPLKLEEDSHIAEDLRLAYKILKNANCLPPEIELKKEIQRTEELLSGMKDTAQKHRTLKKLNYLIMKLNAVRDTSIELEMPQQYSLKMIERLESKNDNKLSKK